jgi:hypothetical protein
MEFNLLTPNLLGAYTSAAKESSLKKIEHIKKKFLLMRFCLFLIKF